MKKKMIDWSIYIYILSFILYSFSGRIMPIYLCIGNKINSLIYAAFAGLGILLIICDCFVSRKMLKTRYFKILCIFILAVVLSCIININLGYIDNIKTIIWTVIQITIFYSLYLRIPQMYIPIVLKRIFLLISIIWTMFVSVSLIQFVIQDAYMYDITGVGYKYQGFFSGRLFGVFNDPNFAAVTSGYVIIMLIYLYRKMKKTWYKIIGIITTIFFNVLYVLLSGSRTAIISLFFALFIYCFFELKNIFYEKKHNLLYSSLGSILIMLVLYFVSMPVKNVVTVFPEMYTEKYAFKIGHMKQDKILMTMLRERDDVILYWKGSENEEIENNIDSKSFSKNMQETSENGEKNTNVKVEEKEDILERRDIRANDISNNRFQIWKEYFQGMKGRYIFGTSPRNMLAYLEKTGIAEFVLYREYETHNGYLSLFVGCGIVGCIPIFVFVYLTGKHILKYCFGKEKVESEFIVLFSIICLILIYTIFFTELFFVNNLTTALFWSMLGFLWIWVKE